MEIQWSGVERAAFGDIRAVGGKSGRRYETISTVD